MEFPSKIRLLNHLKFHENFKYQCHFKDCSMKFATIKFFNEHRARAHGTKIKINGEKSNDQEHERRRSEVDESLATMHVLSTQISFNDQNEENSQQNKISINDSLNGDCIASSNILSNTQDPFNDFNQNKEYLQEFHCNKNSQENEENFSRCRVENCKYCPDLKSTEPFCCSVCRNFFSTQLKLFLHLVKEGQ